MPTEINWAILSSLSVDSHEFRAVFKSIKIVAAFALLWLLADNAFATTLPNYNLTAGGKILSDFQVSFYLDDSDSHSYEQAKTKLLTGQILNSRFSVQNTAATHWFAFSLTNTDDKRIDKVIWFGEVFMHHVDLYFENNGIIEELNNGLAIPIAERDFTNRLPVFEISLAPQETRDFYFKVNSKFVNYIGIFIGNHHEFSYENANSVAGYYMFFGGSLSLLAFNLFLYFSLKDKSYLIYVCYGSLYVFFASIYGGFSLFAFKTATAHYFIHCSISLVFVFMALFIRRLLETKNNFKFADSVLKIIMLLFFVLSILIAWNIAFYELFLKMAIVAAITFWIIGVLMVRRGSKIARFYLLATTLYLLGIGISASLALGFLPYSIVARHAYMIGSISEMIIFALALGYRYRLIQDEKLAAERTLTIYEKEQRADLERIVEERTLQLQNANAQLTLISFTDSLTGIANRRFFDDALAKEWNRMHRASQPLSVIMCDIDFFKSYNDSFGHQAGDACLQKIAQSLAYAVKRSSDVVARFGGEEFAIILPDTNAETAVKLCKLIQRDIAALKIPTPDHIELAYLTLSFGVSSRQPKEGETSSTLIAEADKALYQSKQQGRDRISVYAH